MRVLIVVHGFPPAGQGGSEIYAALHAHALQRRGDEVVVLTRDSDASRPEYDVREETPRGLRVVRVNNTFRAVRSFEESYAHPKIAAIAAGLIDDFNPDVAHIHHLTCLSTLIPERLAAAGVPSVMTLHDYWLLCHRGQLLDRDLRVCERSPSACARCVDAPVAAQSALGLAARAYVRVEPYLPDAAANVVRGLGRQTALATTSEDDTREAAARRFAHMRHAAGHCQLMLAPSAHLRDRFIAAGYPAERIRLSRYGFDGGAVADARTPRRGPLRVGFVGSLMVSKGPHLLLEAIRRLPAGAVTAELFGAPSDYHGDSSYRGVLEPLLATPGVTLRGWTSHEAMRRAYASMDVLVVPSIWPENSPLVIQEAFLAGVPVVASRAGGIPELVSDDENGLLFESGDVDALRRCLQRLLDEPALLDSLSAARAPVRTIDHDVRSLRTEYERLIETSQQGTSRPLPPGATQQRPPAPGASAIPARVHAVVLNYGTPDTTVIAVRSLLASRHPLASLTVVDNSDDVSCGRALADVSDRVEYFSSARNLGYAGGMNIGIMRALSTGATHVLLVNSDMTVPPDCIGRLLDALEACPGAGIAGPTVLDRAMPDRIESLGLSYDPRTGRMRHRQFHAAAGQADRHVGRVDAVSGCLMLVAREVFEESGLLDQAYFFGFEDLAFCLRAGSRGFSSVVAPAVAFHDGGRSLAPDAPIRLYYATRNHLRMATEAAPDAPAPRRFARDAMIVGWNVAFAFKAPPRRITARLRAVVRGVVDYRRGRFGPAT